MANQKEKKPIEKETSPAPVGKVEEPKKTPESKPKNEEAVDLVGVREKARREAESRVEEERAKSVPLPLEHESNTPDPDEGKKPDEDGETEGYDTGDQPEPGNQDEDLGFLDDDQKLKEKIKRRIGKEVKKSKTLEEELREAHSRIEALEKNQTKPKETQKEGQREPTDDEIKIALRKAREEGDTDYEFEIYDYVAKRNAQRERQAALKEIDTDNNRAQDRRRQWGEIVEDYTITNEKGVEVRNHPMNLNNPDSRLYRTAQALYTDPDLRKERYSRGSEMENLRRAVSDAYLELNKMGASLETADNNEPNKFNQRKRKRSAPTEPTNASPETEHSTQGRKSLMEPTEKIEDEVTRRLKFRREREVMPV